MEDSTVQTQPACAQLIDIIYVTQDIAANNQTWDRYLPPPCHPTIVYVPDIHFNDRQAPVADTRQQPKSERKQARLQWTSPVKLYLELW
jgi:hypothetical protein